MQNIINITKQIGFLTIALTLALVANFAYGQWTNPTATPPSNNAEAPINTSAIAQEKVGNLSTAGVLGGTMVVSSGAVWSDLYCDSQGQNCFDPATIGTGDGSLTCTTETITVSSCNNNNVCSSGWTAVGGSFQVGMSCGEDSFGYGQSCQREVCS